MKTLRKHLIVAAGLLLAQQASARHGWVDNEELVRKADAIAVVHISTPGSTRTGGVPAEVLQTVKGSLPKTLELNSPDNWECSAEFQAGDYLIFVGQHNGAYYGVSCVGSWLLIENGKVYWPRSIKAGYKPRTSLKKALKEISSLGADAIDLLVQRIEDSHGLLMNGGFPKISLPPTAPIEALLKEYFKKASFGRGRVDDFTILEVRQVRIKGALPDQYTAARVKTSLGEKIVIAKHQQVPGWWVRVYEPE